LTIVRRFAGLMAALVVAAPAGLSWAAASHLIGFYVPWDGQSLGSVQKHGGDLDAVIPAWVSVTGPDHKVTIVPDPAGRAAVAAVSPRPQLWLMVQNALQGAWDGPGAATLLRDRGATSVLLRDLEAQAVGAKASGLVLDFEDLPAGLQPDLLAFLGSARDLCRRRGWTLAITAPVSNPDWNLAALGKAADRLILMAYDEHWQTGPPGPIASDPWFGSVVRRALAEVPPGKAIVGIAAYAYDWPSSGPAAVLSIADATALAAKAGAKPVRDQSSGAEHFSYAAGGGPHVVWMSDAVAMNRQIAIARAAGAQAVAVWRLGTEDPSFWGGTSGRRQALADNPLP
jgi:spore germination protein YaaH